MPAEQKISVYLQDALSGAWLGINGKEEFVPASLLKIPIASPWQYIKEGENQFVAPRSFPDYLRPFIFQQFINLFRI